MFCSFPHRHGEATGKPETRDETRGSIKTNISCETSASFHSWRPTKRRGFAASPQENQRLNIILYFSRTIATQYRLVSSYPLLYWFALNFDIFLFCCVWIAGALDHRRLLVCGSRESAASSHQWSKSGLACRDASGVRHLREPAVLQGNGGCWTCQHSLREDPAEGSCSPCSNWSAFLAWSLPEWCTSTKQPSLDFDQHLEIHWDSAPSRAWWWRGNPPRASTTKWLWWKFGISSLRVQLRNL